MKVEKLRAERIAEIVKETVEAIEEYYVHGDTTLYNMVTEKMHLNYKMVSECFKFYTDMRLIDYARNRKYTEMHGTDRNLNGKAGKRKIQEKLLIDEESEEVFLPMTVRKTERLSKNCKIVEKKLTQRIIECYSLKITRLLIVIGHMCIFGARKCSLSYAVCILIIAN